MASSRLLDLVSPRVGVVRDVVPLARGAEEPLPPYLYTATLSNFDFRRVDRQERVTAGKGRTDADARHAAIGEAVERYCAQHWDPRRTRLATWDEVRDAAISPAECVLYADEQYARAGWPFHRWDPTEEVTWLPAIELPSRRDIVVPASLAYLVTPVARAQDYFTNATSNGLAAGASGSAAILGALYEVIERDAFLVTWMNRLPALEIDLADAPDGALASSIVRHYACFGVEVRAFVMRTDAPATVVMAIAFDAHPQRPAALVGLGCHARPGIALEKALFEVCQMRPAELRRYQEHPPRDRVRRYEDVKALADHSAFFSQPRHVRELEFLWSSGEKVRLTDLPDPARGDDDDDLELALARCVEALTANGCRVAYANLTTSDIASLGLSVVRAFVTGFQPMHFGHGNERLGGRHLFELPHRLGLASGPRTAADLNPCPHPLA